MTFISKNPVPVPRIMTIRQLRRRGWKWYCLEGHEIKKSERKNYRHWITAIMPQWGSAGFATYELDFIKRLNPYGGIGLFADHPMMVFVKVYPWWKFLGNYPLTSRKECIY